MNVVVEMTSFHSYSVQSFIWPLEVGFVFTPGVLHIFLVLLRKQVYDQEGFHSWRDKEKKGRHENMLKSLALWNNAVDMTGVKVLGKRTV